MQTFIRPCHITKILKNLAKSPELSHKDSWKNDAKVVKKSLWSPKKAGGSLKSLRDSISKYCAFFPNDLPHNSFEFIAFKFSLFYLYQIGDLVYAKLSIANKDMEPELTCIDTGGKSNGLGQLSDGFMITVSLGLARKYEF